MSHQRRFTIVLLCLAAVAAPSFLLASSSVPAPALEERVAAMGRIGYAFGPQVSPDGRSIAFITALSGSPQVWSIPFDGGYPRQVTAHEDPVSGISWSPDGRTLAYAVSPGGGYSAQIHFVSPQGVHRAR